MSTQKTKILYIDDEEINLLLFVANFEDKYEVLTSPTAKKALDIISEDKSIKFVFADMKMPYMSGLELIRIASTMSPDINYYLLTGVALSSEINNAIDSNLIRKCFMKPFKISELEKEIDKVCLGKK